MSEHPFHRIVLLCDAACDIRLEVTDAAALAARWGASLHGIFIDDENFRRLAALPFGQQVSLSCAALTEEFSAEEMTSLSSARGAAMQRTLSEAARERGVGWSFGQVRDLPSVALLSDDPADTLVIEAATRAFSGAWRPRSARDKSSAAFLGSILLKRRGSGGRGMVVVVPAAAEDRAKVLATSAAFAGTDEPIVLTGSSTTLANAKDEIARSFGARRRHVEQIPIDTGDRSALTRLIARRKPALVVLPPARSDRPLDEFDRDVLLVR